MKTLSLILLLILGFVTSGRSQEDDRDLITKPDPIYAAARKPHVDAEGTLHLSAGPLLEVVAQLELCVPDLPTVGEADWTMPNVLYDAEAGTMDATVPANLRLRKVSPVQALALIAAAAGCALDRIVSPDAEVVGYRIVRESKKTQSPSITGVGVALAQKNGNIVVTEIIPDSPAARNHHIQPGDRLFSVSERGSSDTLVTGLPLEKVVQLIRGTPGSIVNLNLEVDRGDGPKKITVPLVREKLEAVAPDPWIRVKAVTPSSTDLAMHPGAPSTTEGAGSGGSSKPATLPGTLDGRAAANPLSSPSDGDLVVRVYATGSIFGGSERESVEKQKAFEDLVGEALQRAGVSDNMRPVLSFHQKSKALIVEAAARKQPIIQQVITALKENEVEQPFGNKL